MIRSECATVDGKVITKTGFKLEGGERLVFTIPDTAPVDLIPESIPLDILYEDGNILVINKQAGWSSIPLLAMNPAHWFTQCCTTHQTWKAWEAKSAPGLYTGWTGILPALSL